MSEKALKDAGYVMLGNFVYGGNIPVGSLEPLGHWGPEGSFSNAFTSMPIFRKSSDYDSPKSSDQDFPNKEYIDSISEASIKSIIKSIGLDVKYKSDDIRDCHEFSIFTEDPKKVVLAAKAYVKFCDLDVYGNMIKYSNAMLKRCKQDIEDFRLGIEKVFQKEFPVK